MEAGYRGGHSARRGISINSIGGAGDADRALARARDRSPWPRESRFSTIPAAMR